MKVSPCRRHRVPGGAMAVVISRFVFKCLPSISSLAFPCFFCPCIRCPNWQCCAHSTICSTDIKGGCFSWWHGVWQFKLGIRICLLQLGPLCYILSFLQHNIYCSSQCLIIASIFVQVFFLYFSKNWLHVVVPSQIFCDVPWVLLLQLVLV